MPRKYHRPPAVKRRKAKKTAPSIFQPLPEPEEQATTVASPEQDLEPFEKEYVEPKAAAASLSASPTAGGRTATRHLVKDYSYVRTEIVRILAIASFLIISLVITAVLRN